MRFLLTCPLCQGRRRVGIGSAPRACPRCEGLGGIAKNAADLTPAEADAFRRELAPVPPDPDTEFAIEDTKNNITFNLTRHYIQTIGFPPDGIGTLDLISSRGRTVRIFPEFRHGRFHNLNAMPVPPEPSNAS